jgi:methionyl-tRNA formyltransferase
MRIIYMGNPEFAAQVLVGLVKSHHEVIAVIASPSRPQHRGMKILPSPILPIAKDLAIPDIIEQEDLKDPGFLQKLKQLNLDIMVVVAFKFLPARVYNWVKYGAINLHGSLLPQLRGPAPVPWAILNGLSETGVTVFSLNSKIDCGAIYGRRSIALDNDITSPQLFDKLALIGTKLLIEVLDGIENQSIEPIPQLETEVSYAPLLTKEMGLVKWEQSAEYIHRQVRALKPWPSTFTFRGKTRLRLEDVEVVSCNLNLIPGTIVPSRPDEFLVATGSEAIRITRLTPEGKKIMAAAEYLRGYPLKNGEKLTLL